MRLGRRSCFTRAISSGRGGRIVAEAFVGILCEDKLSYQSVDPAWKPDLANPHGTFGMRISSGSRWGADSGN